MKRDCKLDYWNVIAVFKITELEANSHVESPLLTFRVKTRQGGLFVRHGVDGGRNLARNTAVVNHLLCNDGWMPELILNPSWFEFSDLISVVEVIVVVDCDTAEFFAYRTKLLFFERFTSLLHAS
jgi:hypothetical protein